MRIAFIGKGGNGKSTLAGSVARLLGRAGVPVLALDVDTLPGLSISLGLGITTHSTLPDDLAERREKEGWVMKDPIPRPADLVNLYAQAAPDNVKLLQVGKLPAPIPQSRNTTFRYILERFEEPGWSVVADLAAGVRQASYGWAFSSTLLAIVMEPTQASAMTARRLSKLVQEQPGVQAGVILNKQNRDRKFAAWNAPVGLPIWATIPYSEDVVRAEREGIALLDLAPSCAVIVTLQEMIATCKTKSL